MQRLPHWVIPDNFPLKFDCESSTAIEQTARLYGAIQTLIDEHNAFIKTVNESVDTLEQEIVNENVVFSMALRQEFQDFIDVVNLQVEKLEQYVTNNLQTAINDLFKTGALNVGVQYNIEDESLTLITE